MLLLAEIYPHSLIRFPIVLHGIATYSISFQRWYALSETLVEEPAWNFAKEHAIDMVAINPMYVIGPLLRPTLNGSMQIVLVFMQGIRMQLEIHEACWLKQFAFVSDYFFWVF